MYVQKKQKKNTFGAHCSFYDKSKLLSENATTTKIKIDLKSKCAAFVAPGIYIHFLAGLERLPGSLPHFSHQHNIFICYTSRYICLLEMPIDSDSSFFILLHLYGTQSFMAVDSEWNSLQSGNQFFALKNKIKKIAYRANCAKWKNATFINERERREECVYLHAHEKTLLRFRTR